MLAMKQTNQRKLIGGKVWISVLILVGVGIALAGLWYYRVEKDRIRKERYADIASVADLKIEQIESWRLDRLDDARVLSGSPFTRRAIHDLVNAPANAQLRRAFLERLDLEGSLSLGLYSDAFVLDTTGRTLVSASTPPSVMDTSERVTLREAILKRKPVLTDLFRGVNGIVHIDAMASILDESGRTLAVVVLRSDADIFIYPLIDSWPVPSRSAETLLLEKNGDHVVFLSHLRYNSAAPLSLRIPLTSTTTPGVQAALGKVGMFEGKDYQGEEVLADLRPVPNTSWFMVAKVDEDETLAEAEYRGGVVILFVVLFIAISATATAYLYRHRQAGIYREMYHAELERKEVQEEFKATLYSIGDAVITTDIHGQIKHMNPVAEHLTGWTEHDAKGKVLEEVFRVVEEDTHSEVESPVTRVLKEGFVVGLANHTLLISRDGTEHPIADSGAPIRGESGIVTGVVLIFRDQTKEREAENKLSISETRYRRLFESAKDGILIVDAETGIIMDANPFLIEMLGLSREQFLGKEVWQLGFLKDVISSRNNFWELQQKGYIRYEDLPLQSADGRLIDVEFVSNVYLVDHKKIIQCNIRNISDRKHAETALRESQQMLRTVMDTVPVRVFWKDKNGIYLGCNLPFAKDSGFNSSDEIVGKDDFQMGWREQAELYRADDKRVIESGIPKIAYEEPQSFDKGMRWLRTSKIPLRNAENEIIGMLGTYEDITEAKQSELLLAHERYLLNALLENTVDAIYFKDTEGRFTRVSATMAAKRGLTSTDQLLGKTDFDFFAKETAQKIYEQEQEIIRTQKPVVDVEIQELWTDRAPTWASVTKVPLHDQAGKIIGLFGISRDITDRKQAEASLRESESHMRTIVEGTPHMFFYTQDTQGRITYTSPSVETITGRSVNEWRSQSHWFATKNKINDHARELTKAHLRGEFMKGPIFVEVEHADQRPILLEVYENPIVTEGKVTGLQGVAHDVTERKNAEIALRESEERFRGLVEGSAAAIWIHDVNRFLYANPAGLEMTGYTAEELYKLAPVELVAPESREVVMKRADERIRGKDVPKHYEYQILKKSGETIWIDFSGATIDYQGKPAIIASAYDITQRKNLEGQLLQSQKMEGIGRLAGGVAHDYNNMLGVIIGYSDLIMKKMDKADSMYRYAELIASAARHGADITKQLLAFARREIVSPRVLDPNEEIGSLQKMLERLIGENVKLVFLPEKDVWNIRMDQTQFDQILVNLATNARDAIDDVGVITIETSNVTINEDYVRDHIDFSPGEYVLISFADTGKGMSKETMGKIFEPFFTTKPKGEGTGLGLSTIYGIVKQNGGNISAYSNLGVGTTFKIYLPRHQGYADTHEETQGHESVAGMETVLVVEDQSDLLELAKNSLREYGYNVLTALSPGEGILLSEEYKGEIHVLLTDVIMPTMNGKELREKIERIRPKIKTVFMSGYTSDVIAHQGVLDHGIDFIQKPFTPFALAKKVYDVLKT